MSSASAVSDSMGTYLKLLYLPGKNPLVLITSIVEIILVQSWSLRPSLKTIMLHGADLLYMLLIQEQD